MGVALIETGAWQLVKQMRFILANYTKNGVADCVLIIR
jgi:hypothetical protein